MSTPLPLEFVTSATTVADLPDTVAEIAVVGRSNVGKSSLLNALANRTNLARVSKTPGRTQLLNLFRMGRDDSGPTVMDLPGYGFANAPKKVRDAWGPMIEGYLLDRENLEMVLVLVDGEVGPTKLDVQMLDWLRSEVISHTVIATKHDKVKSAKRERRKRDLAAGCELEPRDIVWVSASKGVGIDRLRGLIRGYLA